ncbi:hypothetical protein ABPG72_016362 [Tetrahymena utriculariae]
MSNYFCDDQLNEMVDLSNSSEKCEPIKILQQFPEVSIDQVYIRNKVITQNINKLLELVKIGSCNCIGLLGDFRVAYKILSNFVPNLIQVDLEDDILDQFDQLVAYTDGHTVYFVYQDTQYYKREDVFENTDRSLYIRYILDTCQTVILCLNKEFSLNWSDFNPFQNKISTEIKFIEDQSYGGFIVKKIETEFNGQPKESQIVKCSLDCQEIIYTWSEEDSQAINQREYEKNKNKIEKFIDNINYEVYHTSKFDSDQEQELKQTMLKIQQFFLHNKQQQLAIEDIFYEIKNLIKKYQSEWQSNSSLEIEINQTDIEILFRSLRERKGQRLDANDIISETFQEIYQRYQGFCLDCTQSKARFYCQCLNLQDILNSILEQYKQIINFNCVQQISTAIIIEQYNKNTKQFVANLQKYQTAQFITQFYQSQAYFTKQINKFKQKIFIRKQSEASVTQLLRQKIVEHTINALEVNLKNKKILSKNIESVFALQKDTIFSVLEYQLNQEKKNIILLRPLINKFVSNKNKNIISNKQNLYDIKLPKEAHSIMNYFCYDSEIDYIATCNSKSPIEDQKVTIWKVSRNSKGNEQQIFENVFTMHSSDVCIHINSKSKQWIIFDNINQKQAMGEIKQDYSFSQEKSFSNVYSSKIKEISRSIIRVDNCFILNGIEDKIFIYEKQFSQYYSVSLDSNQIEIKNFQLYRLIDDEIKVENVSIHKVYNCLEDKVYVFETDDSLKITDSNYNIKYEVNIDRLKYIDFKIIDNQATVMIVVLYQGCNIESYAIIYESHNQLILTEQEIDCELVDKRKGNPMIDNLVESIKNYGQNFTELGCPQQNNLFCYYEEAATMSLNQQFDLSKKINQYLKECFKALQINQQIIFSENQNLKNIKQLINLVKKFLENNSQPIPKQQLKFLLLTRIPIQISTIKQSNYQPLIDGQLQDQVQFQRSESLLKLKDVKKKMNFGWFEEVLRNIKNESLYVISIFGRQSVGKSSLLNRMFGTRFGVSVSRCTDGVWLGYTSFNDTQILVLDCEGLFSVKRSKAEELKLLQQITLISDISILLTGLEAIDKPFQELLNDLVLSNKNKKAGSIYFQGSLEIFVKDINGENDINKIQSELTPLQNLKIKTNVNYLLPFLHGEFNSDLKKIRDKIMKNLKIKQQNAEQTLFIVKYSIAQLFLDDDTDIELLYYRFQIKNLTKQFKLAYLNINKLKIDEDETQINFTYQKMNKQDRILVKQIEEIEYFEIEEEKLPEEKSNTDATIPLQFNQKKLILSQDKQQTTNSINRICLKKIFDENFNKQQTIDHNNYYQQLQNFFNEVFLNRKKLVIKYYEKNLPKLEKFQSICDEFKNELDQFISEFYEQFQICPKNCKECERRCVNQINHINDCECQTSHFCLQLCQKCITKNDDQNIIEEDIISQNPHYQCQFLFGHQGPHLCSIKTHFCEQNCQFSQCGNQCKLELNHSDLSAHDCKQKHQCKYNCKLYEKCKKTCQLEDGHMEEDHYCNSDKCFEKCIFCDKQCSFNRHDHSILIQDPVKNKQLLTLKYIDEQNFEREVIVDSHLCGESHQCYELCQKKGICKIIYQKEEKEWVSNELKRKFKYNFYKPQNQQEKCSNLIPKWQKTHKEQTHQCSQKNHRCDQKCPECLSFCNKEYNHSGNHQTDIHRNKEQCIFLNKTEENISINDDINQRCYQAGESAEPENCLDSCLRQGRAHFHLRECKGGDLCAQNLFPLKARHSKNTFYPFIDKQYDEILCKTYWNSIGWETPLFNKQSKEKEIELCNYACSHQNHFQKNKKMNFCTKKAWHEGVHSIKKSNCQHEIVYDNKMQICFTVDTTSSMGEVFDQMKSSVENIVNSIKIQDFDIKFAIVCYRDHPKQDESYGDKGLKFFQFTNQAGTLEHIKKLDAKGGGDTPENVICALFYSCEELKWDQNSLKIIIHIGDAPPHGREYGFKSKDPLWTINGCPCGIKRDQVFNQLKLKNIKYFMVKCSSILNQTEKLFKQDFGEFFRKAVDISDFSQINQKITDFIIQEVQQSLEYYHVQPQHA